MKRPVTSAKRIRSRARKELEAKANRLNRVRRVVFSLRFVRQIGSIAPMPKHIFRLSVFIILLALGGSIPAKEVVFIGTSMKTLAGLYKVTYGFAFFGYSMSIGPNGSVSLKAPGPG